MSIVSFESRDEKNISHTIANFLTAYGILRLLRKCGGAKLKGVPVNELFTYTLTNAFRMGSFYMQNKLGQVREGFSKNTYYRFLMNPRTNWLRFTTMLSARIINAHIRPLTSENCRLNKIWFRPRIRLGNNLVSLKGGDSYQHGDILLFSNRQFTIHSKSFAGTAVGCGDSVYT